MEGTDSRVPRWADGDYLRSIAGPGRVVPVETGGKYTDADWGQEIVSWDIFLGSSGWPSSAAHAAKHERRLYLAQYNLLDQFPQLRQDIIIPDVIYSEPPASSHAPAYKQPIDAETGAETVLLNAWLGPAGTESPAHTDPYFNCYGEGAFCLCIVIWSVRR